MISRMRGNECESVGVEFKKVKKKIYMLCGMCGGAVGNIFSKKNFLSLYYITPEINWQIGTTDVWNVPRLLPITGPRNGPSIFFSDNFSRAHYGKLATNSDGFRYSPVAMQPRYNRYNNFNIILKIFTNSRPSFL